MYRELALGTGWFAGAGAVGALLEYSVFFLGYKNSPFCSTFQTTALARASNHLSCCLLQPDVPHVSGTVLVSVTRRCGRGGRGAAGAAPGAVPGPGPRGQGHLPFAVLCPVPPPEPCTVQCLVLWAPWELRFCCDFTAASRTASEIPLGFSTTQICMVRADDAAPS